MALVKERRQLGSKKDAVRAALDIVIDTELANMQYEN